MIAVKELAGVIAAIHQDAVAVMNAIIAYPDTKKQLSTKINSAEDLLNKQEPEPQAPKKQSIPHSEGDIIDKQQECDRIDNRYRKALYQQTYYEEELRKIETSTKTVQQKLSWREADHYSGRSGYPDVHDKALERGSDEPPFSDYSEKFTTTCPSQQNAHYVTNCQSCVDGHQTSWGGDANLSKDGAVYCFTNSHGQYPAVDRNKLLKNPHYTGYDGHSQHRPNCAPLRVYSADPKSGKLTDVKVDKAKGTYKAKYYTPRYCYGSVIITFTVLEKDTKAMVAKSAEYRDKLQTLAEQAANEHASLLACQKTVKDMKGENDKIRRENKVNSDNHSQQTAARQQEKSRLDAEKLQLTKQLESLELSYQNNVTTFCQRRHFWQDLSTLHNILQFQFELKDEFVKALAMIPQSVIGDTCTEQRQLDCKTFEEPTAETKVFIDDPPGNACGFGGHASSQLTLFARNPEVDIAPVYEDTFVANL